MLFVFMFCSLFWIADPSLNLVAILSCVILLSNLCTWWVTITITVFYYLNFFSRQTVHRVTVYRIITVKKPYVFVVQMQTTVIL